MYSVLPGDAMAGALEMVCYSFTVCGSHCELPVELAILSGKREASQTCPCRGPQVHVEMENNMDTLIALGAVVAENWAVWVVTIFLILAAVIDGFELKVPNWLTFPMIVSGWLYSTLRPPRRSATPGTSDWDGAWQAWRSAWPSCCPCTPSVAWVRAT